MLVWEGQWPFANMVAEEVKRPFFCGCPRTRSCPLPALLGALDEQFSFPPNSKRLTHKHAYFPNRRVNQSSWFLDGKFACVFTSVYVCGFVFIQHGWHFVVDIKKLHTCRKFYPGTSAFSANTARSRLLLGELSAWIIASAPFLSKL